MRLLQKTKYYKTMGIIPQFNGLKKKEKNNFVILDEDEEECDEVVEMDLESIEIPSIPRFNTEDLSHHMFGMM
jgi:uncharacterized protein YlaN (UPF0358 family)